MAAMPDHITITVDEKALREQIRAVIKEELGEASLALRRAADALNPEFMPTFIADQESFLRKQWEKESAKAATEAQP